MRNYLKNKLEEIRNSSQKTKTRWVVSVSALAMAIVIFFWLISLDGATMPIGDVPPADSPISKWEIFKAGLRAVGSKLFGSRTINIE